MKKALLSIVLMSFALIAINSCSTDDNGSSTNGPKPDSTVKTDSTLAIDTTVTGIWAGALPPLTPLIRFNGAQINVEIARIDSAFRLVSRDSTRDTTPNPAIGDTSLILTGKWRLNQMGDSLLLICSTGMIIDTAQNILVPRNVDGEVIAMKKSISVNKNTGDVEWEVALADFVPLAPMLGLNLSSIQQTGVLQVVKIILVKRKQL